MVGLLEQRDHCEETHSYGKPMFDLMKRLSYCFIVILQHCITIKLHQFGNIYSMVFTKSV